MRQIVIAVTLLMMFIAADAIAETRQLNFTDFDEVSIGYGIRVFINQVQRTRRRRLDRRRNWTDFA